MRLVHERNVIQNQNYLYDMMLTSSRSPSEILQRTTNLGCNKAASSIFLFTSLGMGSTLQSTSEGLRVTGRLRDSQRPCIIVHWLPTSPWQIKIGTCLTAFSFSSRTMFPSFLIPGRLTRHASLRNTNFFASRSMATYPRFPRPASPEPGSETYRPESSEIGLPSQSA